MVIKRRFPNSFSGFEETKHEVKNLEDVKNIPWIKEYNNLSNFIGVFYAENEEVDYLMCLVNSGKDILYYAVGYIYGSGAELGLEDYYEYIEKNKK